MGIVKIEERLDKNLLLLNFLVMRNEEIVGYIVKEKDKWCFAGDCDGLSSFSVEDLEVIIKQMQRKEREDKRKEAIE